MKSRFIALISLFVISFTYVSAQSIIGTWKMTEVDGKPIDASHVGYDILLTFQNDTITLTLEANYAEDGTVVKFRVYINGTYTSSENIISTNFDDSELQGKVIDFNTNDPELSEMIKDPSVKVAYINFMQSMTKHFLDDDKIQLCFNLYKQIYSSFTIKSLAQDYLTLITQDSYETSYKRVQ